MNNPKLITTSLVLAISALLVACGGGETASTVSSTAKQSATVEAWAPAPSASASTVADTTEGSSVHSSDAHVLTANSVRKSLELAPAIVKSVAVNPLGRSTQVPTVDLGAVPEAELTKRDRYNRSSETAAGRKAHQTGIGRSLAATSQTKDFQQLLAWSALTNGNTVGVARFASADASGLRLGLLINHLPDSASVRVSSIDANSALEISGASINRAIAANVAADGDTANARTYWLPMTAGATAELAIELPAGTASDNVTVAVPSLVHVLETAPQASLAQASSKSDCPNLNPDPVCTTVPPAANAVSSYDFIEGSTQYVCTGTLLADKALSNQPYFLTANHCVSTQTVASTMVTYWFYRSSSCNSNTPATPLQYTAGGATFLWHRSDTTTNTRNPIGTDTSFLKLNAAPPSGVMFSGWKTARQAISNSVAMTALHHPAGGVLRQSTGTISNMGVLTPSSLISTADVTQPMYQVTWSSGLTEGGSSGSGLFHNGTTSNPQLVGQLWGGYATCQNPNLPDFYGRFDLAYQDGLITWLNPGYKMVFRFYNVNNGAHFYSANVAERDNVRNTISNLWHEGPVFSVAPAAASGLSPVYRFYNTYTGVHFYTLSESERNALTAYPSFQLEGVAWYARKSADANTVPVYRFYKRSLGTHLYTVSVAERDNLIANAAGTYDYEGVAYHAWAPN
jgi:lysyl endopeptidase